MTAQILQFFGLNASRDIGFTHANAMDAKPAK
jgi:hypothetical protein